MTKERKEHWYKINCEICEITDVLDKRGFRVSYSYKRHRTIKAESAKEAIESVAAEAAIHNGICLSMHIARIDDWEANG